LTSSMAKFSWKSPNEGRKDEAVKELPYL